MANSATWGKLTYFKRDSLIDKWGDPDAISDELLLKLDDFRKYIGVPIIVTAGVATGGHSSGSFHYVRNGACAVDVVCPGYKESAVDLIIDAGRFGFTGLGYYPHWKFNGIVIGGLHLDVRPIKTEADGTQDFKANRWMGVLQDGKQIYLPLSFDNIKKYV